MGIGTNSLHPHITISSKHPTLCKRLEPCQGEIDIFKWHRLILDINTEVRTIWILRRGRSQGHSRVVTSVPLETHFAQQTIPPTTNLSSNHVTSASPNHQQQHSNAESVDEDSRNWFTRKLSSAHSGSAPSLVAGDSAATIPRYVNR